MCVCVCVCVSHNTGILPFMSGTSTTHPRIPGTIPGDVSSEGDWLYIMDPEIIVSHPRIPGNPGIMYLVRVTGYTLWILEYLYPRMSLVRVPDYTAWVLEYLHPRMSLVRIDYTAWVLELWLEVFLGSEHSKIVPCVCRQSSLHMKKKISGQL